MKTIFAIAIISCLIALGLAQNGISQQCVDRLSDLNSCITRLANSGGDTAAFCNECANTLISYYQDCAGGAGVAQVKQGN